MYKISTFLLFPAKANMLDLFAKSTEKIPLAIGIVVQGYQFEFLLNNLTSLNLLHPLKIS